MESAVKLLAKEIVQIIIVVGTIFYSVGTMKGDLTAISGGQLTLLKGQEKIIKDNEDYKRENSLRFGAIEQRQSATEVELRMIQAQLDKITK